MDMAVNLMSELDSNTTLVKVKYYGKMIKFFTYIIQIQHLLKLNSAVSSGFEFGKTIQIQHLLKLN